MTYHQCHCGEFHNNDKICPIMIPFDITPNSPTTNDTATIPDEPKVEEPSKLPWEKIFKCQECKFIGPPQEFDVVGWHKHLFEHHTRELKIMTHYAKLSYDTLIDIHERIEEAYKYSEPNEPSELAKSNLLYIIRLILNKKFLIPISDLKGWRS